MDISARTFRPRTFRPCKMPKVDLSAITINLCTSECINLVGSMLMCVGDVCTCIYMHACRVHACVISMFRSILNFMLSRVEQEKSFTTSRPRSGLFSQLSHISGSLPNCR